MPQDGIHLSKVVREKQFFALNISLFKGMSIKDRLKLKMKLRP